jgi:hypothetical protein
MQVIYIYNCIAIKLTLIRKIEITKTQYILEIKKKGFKLYLGVIEEIIMTKYF